MRYGITNGPALTCDPALTCGNAIKTVDESSGFACEEMTWLKKETFPGSPRLATRTRT